MILERIVIPVVVEQPKSTLNAKCSRHTVDRASDRHAESPQSEIVLRGLDRKLLRCGLINRKFKQVALKPFKLCATANTLKDFAQYQRSEANLCLWNRKCKPESLWIRHSAQGVNPHRTVDDDHAS